VQVQVLSPAPTKEDAPPGVSFFVLYGDVAQNLLRAAQALILQS
jgi:hypothetical protein